MPGFPSKTDYYFFSIIPIVIIIWFLFSLLSASFEQVIGLIIAFLSLALVLGLLFWVIPKGLSGIFKGIFKAKLIVQRRFTADTPRFVEDRLFPWQAIYIYSEGRPDYEDLILSYLFWLAHKNQLSLRVENGQIKVSIPSQILDKLETNPLFLHFGVGLAYAIKYNYQDFKVLLGRATELKSEVIEILTSRVDRYYKLLPNSKLGDRYMPLIMISLLGVAIISPTFLQLPFLIFLPFIERSVLDFVFNCLMGFFSISLLLTVILNRPINTFINNLYFFNREGRDIKDKLDSYNYYLQKVENAKLANENNITTGNLQTYNPHLAYAVAFGYLKDISQWADR
jgi:hypothetical protein